MTCHVFILRISIKCFFFFFLVQVKFGPAQTDVELVDLMPSTDYSVTLYALYDEDPSDPVTALGTTCNYISLTLT